MKNERLHREMSQLPPGVGVRRSVAPADSPRWWKRDCRSVCRAVWSPLLAPTSAAAALALCANASAQLASLPRSVWTHLASTSDRSSISSGGTLALSSPAWVASNDVGGKPIAFLGQSSPVVTRDLVFAVGTIDFGSAAFLFAIDRRNGKVEWQAEVDLPVDSGYATPAIAERESTVIVATGSTVRAFDLSTGSPRWCCPLGVDLTNSSPVVTQDIWGANRVFIADADPFGVSGKLYCINISSKLPPRNPYEPGELVWAVGIGGTSGNTPAYSRGRVYISGVGDYFAFPPVPAPILCFDARATCEPEPLWTYTNTVDPDARFFGGLSVSGSAVYAASYDFVGVSGTFNNSNLVKLDAATGALIWSIACNRTNAIPVVLPPKPGRTFPRVLLSAGLRDFSGTIAALQLYEDRGASAARVWDSAVDTWTDLDHDGRRDPGEYFDAGAWTVQPAVSRGLGPLTAFVGTIPFGGNNSTFPACIRLSAINLDALPASSGFIRQQFQGAGSSPALADANVYTIGSSGLFAFGPPPYQYDVDSDGLVSMEDLIAWEQGTGRLDVNLDGKVTAVDRNELILEVRREEW